VPGYLAVMVEWLFAWRGNRLIILILQCFLRSLPTDTIFERLFKELVDQLGHGKFLMLGFVI